LSSRRSISGGAAKRRAAIPSSRYADVLALMNKGKIVACGDPGSVQKGSLLVASPDVV
jgi:hypothetical protein